MNTKKYELIFCIVNAGFAVEAMEVARKAGAKGGTIIRARGSANPEAEEFFNINIQPDKEMLLILVPTAIKDDVLKSIYKDCGLGAEAKGIAFTLPVNHHTGIKE